jgi:hypothetical protein
MSQRKEEFASKRVQADRYARYVNSRQLLAVVACILSRLSDGHNCKHKRKSYPAQMRGLKKDAFRLLGKV